MRVPLGWLRDYVELPADAQQVADILARLGFPVDAIERRPAIAGVVVGRIATLDKHPNADRLHVGRVDVGDSTLTIATAATNVAAGQTIAVATIGAQLPGMTIERRKMRGLESEGMMISAEELALPAEWFEDGILQLDESAAPGSDLVETFRLNDAVLDVDVTSNRVDAMSMIGLARELAAYQGVALRLPDLSPPPAKGAPEVAVTIETPDCRRFVAQLFTGIRVCAAPAWMRVRLALAGQRPINNIVDVSNYVMLETGQPLHFYDADKIPNHHLIVRGAGDGERLVTLDSAAYDLTPAALVIASENGAEGLAGLKGGKSSEVQGDTTSILLESANFAGGRIRRTSARLGLRTDAGTRHEKTLPRALTDAGANRAARLLEGFGAQAHPAAAFGEDLGTAPAILFDSADVRRLLGFDLTIEEIRELLDRLGFEATPDGERCLTVTPPPWRPDVTLPADIVEEVARMAGYDRIQAAMPPVAEHGIGSADYRLARKIACALAALAYREIISYSLHGVQIFQKLERAGVSPSSQPVEVINPLSEDQRYLRYALGPAMLEYFARVDAPIRVFELGEVFAVEDLQPMETPALAFGFTAEPAGDPPWRDDNFLRIKGDCEELIQTLTGRPDFDVVADTRNGLHPGKTAVIMLDGREVANVGRIDPRVEKSFGLRLPAYVCSIYLENIPGYTVPRFTPPSKYPSTYRDVALVCSLSDTASSIERCVAKAAGDICTGARAFDEYRGNQVPASKKSLAVRMTLQRRDRTITDAEADAAVDRALTALQSELGVTLREAGS